MKRFSLIHLCLLVLLAAPLGAEEVKATVLSMQGKATYTNEAGQKAALRSGAVLRMGTRLATSDSSSVQLLLADGSKLTLGTNTELTLTEMTKADSSFGNVFNLLKGVVRATVQKLSMGGKFEVASVHGVAAVKGTEFEVESDDSGMDVRCREGKVWLSDLKREHYEEIRERHGARAVREKVGKALELKKHEWERLKDWADASLIPRTAEQQARHDAFWGRLRPDQKLKVLQELRHALGDTWTEISTLREEERQARWRERVRNIDERRLAAEDAHIDFTLGRSLLDRQGRRVRFDEFLLRPAPDQIQFLNYSRREGRTDLLNAVNYYNQALPRRLSEAKGMNQKVWYQSALNPPQYWVTRQTVMFANDRNDSLFGDTRYFDPARVGVGAFGRWELAARMVELWANVPVVVDPIASGTGNGVLLERYTRTTFNTYNTGAVGAGQSGGNTAVVGGGATGRSVSSYDAANSDLAWSGGIGFGTGQAPVTRALGHAEMGTVAGDLAQGFERSYADGTKISLKGYAIDENGRVRNLADLLNKPLFEAYTDLGFRTYQEVEVGSSLFKREINVVSQMLWWSTITKTSDRL